MTKDELKRVLLEVTARIERRHVARIIWEPQVTLEIKQRHFYAQRESVVDGRLRFDIETVVPAAVPGGGVKNVPAWLDAAHAMIASKGKANFELALAARFPHEERSVSRGRGFVDALVSCAQAFEPLRQCLLG